MNNMPFRLAGLTSMATLVGLTQLGCGSARAEADDEQTEASQEDAIRKSQCNGTAGDTLEACKIYGELVDMFIGELDPVHVGDVCIAFVKADGRKSLYALVEDVSSCSFGELADYTGSRVWFSKRDYTYISDRVQRDELKDYRSDAVYYWFDGGLHTIVPDAVDRDAFDALRNEDKMRALYENYSSGVYDGYFELKSEFKTKPIRIVDTFDGAARDRALKAYTEFRNYSFGNGGDKPDVYEISKDGVVYAYGMSGGGRTYGNWWWAGVYDREFNVIGSFGGSD